MKVLFALVALYFAALPALALMRQPFVEYANRHRKSMTDRRVESIDRETTDLARKHNRGELSPSQSGRLARTMLRYDEGHQRHYGFGAYGHQDRQNLHNIARRG